MNDRPKVAVVGGGVAGLVAARTLAIGGAEVTVFEAAPYVGGRCHRGSEFAFEHDGRHWQFALEHGIHGLWRQYRNLRRILDDEGKGGALVAAAAQELVVPHPTRGVQAYEFGARVRHAPLPDLLSFLMVFTASDFLAQSLREGPLAWQRSFFDLLHAFAFDARRDIERYDDVSVADFIEGWPLILQRMSGAITHSAFFREARDVGLAAYLTGLQSYFVSDKRDTAFDFLRDDAEVDLLGPLRARIEACGGRIRTGVRVLEVRPDDDHAIRIRSQREGATRSSSTRFDGVVLAVDPPGLARLRDEGGLADALDPQARIPEGVHSCVVRLFFDRDLAADRAPTGVFHGLPADNFFWLHRLQRPFVAYHAATGGAVLECHLYGDRAVTAATLDDAAVLAQVEGVVDVGWPELRGARIAAHVQRNAASHVAFGPGVMAKVPSITTHWPNMALCGDWIALDSPVLYLERATTTGLIAAAHVGRSVGLAPEAFPEPLPPYPPAPDVARVGKAARWLRDRGLLPLPGGRARRG